MPITMVGKGETVTIKRIVGDDKVRQHLAELGFVVDAVVKVVNKVEGSVILQVHQSRVALNKDMANRIMV